MRTLIALLLVLAGYGIAGHLDYAEEMRQEVERQTARANQHRDALLACLNGGSPGLYTTLPDGARNYIVCDRVFEVNDRNVRKSS